MARAAKAVVATDAARTAWNPDGAWPSTARCAKASRDFQRHTPACSSRRTLSDTRSSRKSMASDACSRISQAARSRPEIAAASVAAGLRHESFAIGVRRLAERLPILWRGSVLDGELTTGRFRTTLAAATGSAKHGPALRLVVFDVPILAGVDLRQLTWYERRERLELLARALEVPFELSPVVQPSPSPAEQMLDGRLERIVVKDRRSTYRDGSRAGWFKFKDRTTSSRAPRGRPGRGRPLAHGLPRGPCLISRWLHPSTDWSLRITRPDSVPVSTNNCLRWRPSY